MLDEFIKTRSSLNPGNLQTVTVIPHFAKFLTSPFASQALFHPALTLL
jgi:hypothetical protein